MIDNQLELKEKPIKSLLWKYFVPSFVGMIINSMYNIIDRIFIGQIVGADALSGISIVFPIMIIVAGFGMLLGVGGAVRISINLGKKDMKQAEKVLGNAFVCMIFNAILVTVLGLIFMHPILQMFGATETTVQYATSYLRIVLLGTIFQLIGFSLNNIIRSEGNAKIAMYSMLISASMNIILDAIFIKYLNMGVEGAAYATILSMMVLAIWVIFHFRSSRSVVKLYWHRMKPDFVIIGRIFSIGMSPFFMQFGASAIQLLFNKLLIQYSGDIAVGALGVVNSVSILVVMSILSINMASQPIIGYNYGASQFDRVIKTWKLAILMATVISTISCLIIQIAPGVIVYLFNSENKELMELGKEGLRIFTISFPLIGLQIVTINYFQSIGKAQKSMVLTLLRQFFLLIPLLLILPNFWGARGVWASSSISDTISFCVMSYFAYKEFGRLNRLNQGKKIELDKL